MIGKLTRAIVGEFGGGGVSDEDREKMEVNFLLNKRCKTLIDYEYFHIDWMHRI